MSFIKSWFGGSKDEEKKTQDANAAAAASAGGEPSASPTTAAIAANQDPVPENEADEVLPENNRSLLAQVIEDCTRAGAEPVMCAPDVAHAHVVDHQSGQEMEQERKVRF